MTLAPAAAQGPSHEGRGYGGPLYVGPNFQQGGQHAPPDYSKKPVKKTAPAKPHRATKEAARPRQPAVKKEAAVEKAPTAETESTTTVQSSIEGGEAGTGTTSAAGTSTPDASAIATCKKFDSTTGQTFSVPCE
jgi:hypothetical protein